MTELELDDAVLTEASSEPPQSRLGRQLGRLAKQSAIYGLGSMVSRLLAVILIGVGLVLDPTEPTAARQAREHFDAALADASSL